MLKGRGLSRRAADGTELLVDVSIDVGAGDRLALVGPSGAGKSLLLRALALLDRVDSGHVEWRGSVPTRDRVPSFRRQVLYLQQRPMVSETSVEAQLSLPWTFRTAGGSKFERAQALRLLEVVGRDAGFLDQTGGNLSGGEGQLLALIRALLLEPTVLLLDEPTSAMDGATRAGAEAILDQWSADVPERAWIWVSHDPLQLERMCGDEILVASGRRVG